MSPSTTVTSPAARAAAMFGLAAPGEVVEDDDLAVRTVVLTVDEAIEHVRADQTGTPRHDDLLEAAHRSPAKETAGSRRNDAQSARDVTTCICCSGWSSGNIGNDSTSRAAASA